MQVHETAHHVEINQINYLKQILTWQMLKSPKLHSHQGTSLNPIQHLLTLLSKVRKWATLHFSIITIYIYVSPDDMLQGYLQGRCMSIEKLMPRDAMASSKNMPDHQNWPWNAGFANLHRWATHFKGCSTWQRALKILKIIFQLWNICDSISELNYNYRRCNGSENS